MFTDGVYEDLRDDDSADIASALIAGAAPVKPPKDWFRSPDLQSKTPITVTKDGRIFGHIATWDSSHIGLPNGIRPPKSKTGYAFFRTGVLETEEGDDVPVGQLTLAGGHAPLSADAGGAVKHYDDTASAVADLAAGDDGFGIWVAGALRPGVTEEQIRALRASAPSGDWRPINGGLELVAICQVNVPGFPVARAMVAGGEVMALVAAGAHDMYQLQIESWVMNEFGKLAAKFDDLTEMVQPVLAAASAPAPAKVTDAELQKLRLEEARMRAADKKKAGLRSKM